MSRDGREKEGTKTRSQLVNWDGWFANLLDFWQNENGGGFWFSGTEQITDCTIVNMSVVFSSVLNIFIIVTFYSANTNKQ